MMSSNNNAILPTPSLSADDSKKKRPLSAPSSSSSLLSSSSHHPQPSQPQPTRLKTNRLFLSFTLLSFIVAIINIQFHHRFHDEHVHEKSLREFQGLFNTQRQSDEKNGAMVDDYVLKRLGEGQQIERQPQSQQQSQVQQSQSQQVPAAAVGKSDKEQQGHKLAGLKCQENYGGPADDYAEKEMAFWSDIPSDAAYKSPFMEDAVERFLTFEPDHGGWNNIRMAMETALVMSHAMGRTLVLPPSQRFYLLGKSDQHQKSDFDFGDFFHLDSIAVEHEGFNVITAEEFLERYGKTGQLRNVKTGEPEIWQARERHTASYVHSYLSRVGVNPNWNPMECAAAFPSSKGEEAVEELKLAHQSIFAGTNGQKKPTPEEFEGKPTPVDASVEQRMREMLADRTQLCIYDTALQNAPILHFPAKKGTRLLTHFYAFIFFADWKADLWSKRFVRDHLRYVDEIMCAAARVVQAVRERSKEDGGMFDSVHVRRGDFQYKKTRLEADKLIQKSESWLKEGGLLYIATDERDKSFFDPFREHYDIVFLDDFKDLLKGINTNYYGMLDQLVASKGRVFVGTWWSTLSGYVNRMRGYYIAKHKLEGYEDGTMESYYFFPDERQTQMKKYMPVKKPIYMREFPISWRDIDKGIEEIHQKG